MGLELLNNFEDGLRDQQYRKLTFRHHTFHTLLRDYVSPNQAREVFGDLVQQTLIYPE